MDDKTLARLQQLALEAQTRAYCPYSNFEVGAALVTVDGQFFAGCNVENAAYGDTICAEASAIAQMVSQLGKQPIKAILVVSPTPDFCPPCGSCRQKINEFAMDDTRVHLVDSKKSISHHLIRELLPLHFSLKSPTEL